MRNKLHITFIVLFGLYALGLFYFLAQPVANKTETISLQNMHSVQCDDIVRDPNGKLVCEVTLQAEDDNIIILKEN